MDQPSERGADQGDRVTEWHADWRATRDRRRQERAELTEARQFGLRPRLRRRLALLGLDNTSGGQRAARGAR